MIKKVLFFSILIFSVFWVSVFSETALDIQKKIKFQDEEIKNLEIAIKESQKKVDGLSGQTQSLKKEIANLNYLNSRLKKTIYEKEIEIEKISGNINTISEKIQQDADKLSELKKNLSQNIFEIYQHSNTPLLEQILAGKKLSEITDEAVKIEKLQRVFKKNILKFSEKLQALEKEKIEREEVSQKLEEEKEDLSEKKFVLEKNQKDKNYLLIVTKNKEENFKKILDEQKKNKEEFEKEIFELESKLSFILDKNKVAKKKVGLFGWPTPSRSDRISQFFGYTDFHSHYATQKRHNGIDIAVPTGTKIYSVMSGTILDTGDSTKICARKQYGKWIAIDHGNGLTSMYAHLSKINVEKGQRVKRGQKIGLAGNTGYSFGSHLHFTVYYTDGLEIKTITKYQKGCNVYPQNYKLPLAPLTAYVDPFDYLQKPIFSRLKPSKFGDVNIYVKELQNMLTYEKYMPKGVDIDGHYGPLTEKYVDEWKYKKKIKTSGKIFEQSDIDIFKRDF